MTLSWGLIMVMIIMIYMMWDNNDLYMIVMTTMTNLRKNPRRNPMIREATPVATAIITTFSQIDSFGFYDYDIYIDDALWWWWCHHYIGAGQIGDLFLTHQRGDSHLLRFRPRGINCGEKVKHWRKNLFSSHHKKFVLKLHHWHHYYKSCHHNEQLGQSVNQNKGHD